MKKTLIILLTGMLILAFAGVSAAIHKGSDSTSGKSGLLTIGANMWRHITKNEPYKEWDLWPGTKKMYKGTQPHGAYLTTYVTRGAKQAIEGKKGKFSQGAIIVKENYTPDKTLAAITVMYKANGYNSEAGDWFWAKYKPDGTIDAEGAVASCIRCHSRASDNDWVFTGELK
jgi:hypothetical protein